MATKFLYFDLGNVLLTFNNEQSCEQLAKLIGLSYSQVAEVVLKSPGDQSLLWQFEHGLMSEQEFYGRFCVQLGVAPDRAAFDLALSDMFGPKPESFALVEALHTAGHRLGILSNTNPIHWRFATDGRWPVLGDAFELHVTSFEAESMKPQARIFQYAIDRAGVAASEVFFVDDLPANVAGALAVGIDAVQYVDHATLVADLEQREIQW